MFVGPQASCEKGLLGLPLAYHRASLLLCLGEDLPQLRLSKDVHEFHLVSLPETSHWFAHAACRNRNLYPTAALRDTAMVLPEGMDLLKIEQCELERGREVLGMKYTFKT